MLVNTRVEDDQLRALALRRATAVESVLAKSAPDAASRLFLVTPRLTAGNVELRPQEGLIGRGAVPSLRVERSAASAARSERRGRGTLSGVPT